MAQDNYLKSIIHSSECINTSVQNIIAGYEEMIQNYKNQIQYLLSNSELKQLQMKYDDLKAACQSDQTFLIKKMQKECDDLVLQTDQRYEMQINELLEKMTRDISTLQNIATGNSDDDDAVTDEEEVSDEEIVGRKIEDEKRKDRMKYIANYKIGYKPDYIFYNNLMKRWNLMLDNNNPRKRKAIAEYFASFEVEDWEALLKKKNTAEFMRSRCGQDMSTLLPHEILILSDAKEKKKICYDICKITIDELKRHGFNKLYWIEIYNKRKDALKQLDVQNLANGELQINMYNSFLTKSLFSPLINMEMFNQIASELGLK